MSGSKNEKKSKFLFIKRPSLRNLPFRLSSLENTVGIANSFITTRSIEFFILEWRLWGNRCSSFFSFVVGQKKVASHFLLRLQEPGDRISRNIFKCRELFSSQRTCLEFLHFRHRGWVNGPLQQLLFRRNTKPIIRHLRKRKMVSMSSFEVLLLSFIGGLLKF